MKARDLLHPYTVLRSVATQTGCLLSRRWVQSPFLRPAVSATAVAGDADVSADWSVCY